MDGYARVKLLGEGSFGRVFLMREKKPDGRLVCMKQIHRVHHPARIPAHTDRAKSHGVEVELMKKLRHPNLIRLLFSFITPAPIFQQHIVMEYCSGGDLRTYLRRSARGNDYQAHFIGEDRIWYWFVQLALGLHHMHQQRVLHRDLKTANIFLSNAGFLVLGDLGIARTLTNGNMAATVIGTPLYMAPEALEGKEYSFSSDVWALGCVLYELCTGKPPFEAHNTAQLLNKICHGSYPPIQKNGILAGSRLPILVASMLSARPEQRPSVDQLLRDPNSRTYIRRYYFDRLHSKAKWGLTEEERHVMVRQMSALGIDNTVAPSRPVDSENNMTTEGGCPRKSACSFSYLHRGEQKKHLEAVRKHERQEHILFELDKMQQLRLQFPVVQQPDPEIQNAVNNKDDKVVVLQMDLEEDIRKELTHAAQWKDPVRAVDDDLKRVDRPRSRASMHLGRSSSVPKELAFTGIPRPGVPLTCAAKIFAAGHFVCRDVRILRKQETAKAAERYKRHLEAKYTHRQQKGEA